MIEREMARKDGIYMVYLATGFLIPETQKAEAGGSHIQSQAEVRQFKPLGAILGSTERGVCRS